MLYETMHPQSSILLPTALPELQLHILFPCIIRLMAACTVASQRQQTLYFLERARHGVIDRAEAPNHLPKTVAAPGPAANARRMYRVHTAGDGIDTTVPMLPRTVLSQHGIREAAAIIEL